MAFILYFIWIPLLLLSGCNDNKKVKLPITIDREGIPNIEITVNKRKLKGPIAFGSFFLYLNHNILNDIKKKHLGFVSEISTNGAIEQLPLYETTDMYIKNYPMGPIILSESADNDEPVVIGSSFFKNQNVFIDFPKKELSIGEKLNSMGFKPEILNSFQKIKCKALTPRIVFSLESQDGPIDFVLGTEEKSSYLLERAIMDKKFSENSWAKIGKEKIMFEKIEHLDDADNKVPFNGVLAMDVLKYYQIYIDRHTQSIYFRKSK